MKSPTKRGAIVMLSAFAVTLVTIVIVARESTEPLTRGALDRARQRWRDASIDSYNYHYRMHGSEYEVCVQVGAEIEVLVAGRSPEHVDVDALTVDGLFDMLALELDNIHDSSGPFAGHLDTVIARVRFNAELGYVEHYVRSAAGRGRAASIELIAFLSPPDNAT